MITFEPPSTTCNSESGLVTTTVLDDNVETLSAKPKDMAGACPSTCQVAESMTKGMEVDNLGGLSKERIEDLGRCIALAQPYLYSLIQVVSTEIP